MSLSKNINHSLVVLVQPRKTRAFITERLLIGRKESNQTNLRPYADSDCYRTVITDKPRTSRPLRTDSILFSMRMPSRITISVSHPMRKPSLCRIYLYSLTFACDSDPVYSMLGPSLGHNILPDVFFSGLIWNKTV